MNIRYGRVFNLGDYETERIEMEDSVGDGETTEGAVERLKELVNNSASIKPRKWGDKKAHDEW